MRTELARAGARSGAAVIVLTLLAVACSAAPAWAGTLQITNGTATPEQDIPVQLTFSGTADPGNNSWIDAVVRPAGGLPCQTTYESDQSAAGNANDVLLDGEDNEQPPGSFSQSATFKPPAPGSYLVCAWLAQPSNNTTTETSPEALSFPARGPQVSQLSVVLPVAPRPKVGFQIDYTTQTDQNLSLYSVLKRAGSLPCASSYELEQQANQSETAIFDGENSPELFGGPTVNTATDTEDRGSYLICTWVEGPDSGEVDATAVTPVTVGTPIPPPVVAASPDLHFTRVRASRRHGVSYRGTAAAGLSGQLFVTASCGRASRAGRTSAARGVFSGHLKLPRGCRGHKKATLRVLWSGSSAFTRESAKQTVRIRR